MSKKLSKHSILNTALLLIVGSALVVNMAVSGYLCYYAFKQDKALTQAFEIVSNAILEMARRQADFEEKHRV